jgi:enterochelin esterase family protein
MLDYAMSDTLVDAFVHELRPVLVKKYRLSEKPSDTAIMGASLGGLIATYAGLTRPDVFGVVAAQSPAYSWRNGQIMAVARQHEKNNIRFYIDTGTIRDARDESLKMKAVLEQRGYDVEYAEYPEGHNWVNWRARLDEILLFFRATQDRK